MRYQIKNSVSWKSSVFITFIWVFTGISPVKWLSGEHWQLHPSLQGAHFLNSFKRHPLTRNMLGKHVPLCFSLGPILSFPSKKVQLVIKTLVIQEFPLIMVS